LKFGVWGSGFGVQGSGFGVWGLAFRVKGLGIHAVAHRQWCLNLVSTSSPGKSGR